MDIIRRIHEKMAEKQLLFIFRGDITEKNSLPLLTLLENEMKDDSYGITGRKRLFMFVLESLQNIAKHGTRPDQGMMPLVTYSKAGEGYRVMTANVIAGDHVENLRKRLEQVNNLDVQGIRELYKNILMNSEFSEKGGAGLGLIEMAVKTGNRLDFDFRPAGVGLSYFILSKTVDSTGMGIHNGSPQAPLNGDSVVQIERMMAENNIYMIWSGHVSQSIGEEVLSITESRLSDEEADATLRRRVFNIMVEMLENVSKYNVGRDDEKEFGMPLVALRFENGRYIITTANLVLNDKIDELNEKLDLINSMNTDELKGLFFSSLTNQTLETDSTGNLGLISMARRSGSKLDYDFREINSRYSYFRLTVAAGELSD
jgi:hypothetical protein